MSVDFENTDKKRYCGDGAALAGYLYDECDPAERAAIEAHIATCATCSAELAALGATRSALASWTPPEAELGFRITSLKQDEASSNVLRPARWWQRPLPAWAQVAAAILIFAAGTAIGTRIVQPSQRAAAPASVSQAASISAGDLADLERRLRQEMSAMRTPASVAALEPARMRTAAGDDQLLQRVRALLAESERRQERELALRVAQVMRDVDAQRRIDLSRIERTFGHMEGVTRPELADQRQMINYLIRTASQRPQ
jgi:hypothetical protein